MSDEPKKPLLPSIEETILAYWKENDVFIKTLHKEAPNGNFVFYEGPPTANAKPAIHHVESRSFKDIVPRYKTMRGFKVNRKAGWDTHGLPVELQIEKKLGLKNKKDIEHYGIVPFNAECRTSVWEFKKEWEKLTERIAFWLDIEHPYVTYENEYIESLWWVIKRFWDKGLLYHGHKVVPHCPRCGTALSSHEVAQGYKTVTDTSVIVKFQISNFKSWFDKLTMTKKGHPEPVEGLPYILSWTTTPWTLPGNVALAVGADIEYVLVKQRQEYYILAKNRLEILGGEYQVLQTFKGKELEGVEYAPLFNSLTDAKEKKHYVTTADFVSTTDGTGVVHTAVMYGEDDYRLGEIIGLPKVHTVNEDGTFNERVSQWQGVFVKDAEKDIIEHLRAHTLLYTTLDYEHEYPFCWRCNTPLLYYAKSSWFVRMSSLRKQLIENNSKINWYPEHIRDGRFGGWLQEAKDWAFSRERYWGTPLPIWKCSSCETTAVIGSIAELENISGKKIADLHKPFIDDVIFPCEKCGTEMHRIPDVCDVWFDSGAMPFAQSHFPFEQAKKENLDPLALTDEQFAQLLEKIEFPADYISEAIDQTRGWFYTLLATATALGLPAPYKNVICLGHILDKEGKKMSKSKGNVIDPWMIINQYGADSVRWYMYTINQPGESKRFDEQGLKETSRLFMTLLNVVTFYKTFAGNEKIENLEAADLTHPLDIWINTKLNALIADTTKKMDSYDITSAARGIEECITELSTWYIRRSRDRFKSDDAIAKMQAIKTLRYTVFNIARLLAPFTPFIAEHIYSQEMNGRTSVHLTDWPEPTMIEKDDVELLKQMEQIRKIASLILEQREKAKIPVRQPLASARITNYQLPITNELAQLIKDETNIKEIEFLKGTGELSVELDTTLNEELETEGLLREITRQVNALRKKEGLTINDRIIVHYQTENGKIASAIEQNIEHLSRTTLSLQWQIGFAEPMHAVTLQNSILKIFLEKK